MYNASFRQNDYGYGGGTYQRSASADASGSVYGIKDQQILSNYGEQTKILEFPIGHHHDHIQGHGHHAYGHSSRPAASGYGKKFNLKNLPLVGGFFGSKTSGGAGGGIYNSGSSYSIDGFNDPGTAFEFKINAKENQYSNERIEGETHVWKSSELEMQSSENPSKSCNKKIKTPMNAAVKCSSEVCKVKCMADYQFPNGDTMLTISCIDGEWVMQGSEWDETPSCERKQMIYFRFHCWIFSYLCSFQRSVRHRAQIMAYAFRPDNVRVPKITSVHFASTRRNYACRSR